MAHFQWQTVNVYQRILVVSFAYDLSHCFDLQAVKALCECVGKATGRGQVARSRNRGPHSWGVPGGNQIHMLLTPALVKKMGGFHKWGYPNSWMMTGGTPWKPPTQVGPMETKMQAKIRKPQSRHGSAVFSCPFLRKRSQRVSR